MFSQLITIVKKYNNPQIITEFPLVTWILGNLL